MREQLKWIKKRREEINKRRGRKKKHSDDVIDLLGVDGAVTEETDGKDEQVYKIFVFYPMLKHGRLRQICTTAHSRHGLHFSNIVE